MPDFAPIRQQPRGSASRATVRHWAARGIVPATPVMTGNLQPSHQSTAVAGQSKTTLSGICGLGGPGAVHRSQAKDRPFSSYSRASCGSAVPTIPAREVLLTHNTIVEQRLKTLVTSPSAPSSSNVTGEHLFAVGWAETPRVEAPQTCSAVAVRKERMRT